MKAVLVEVILPVKTPPSARLPTAVFRSFSLETMSARADTWTLVFDCLVVRSLIGCASRETSWLMMDAVSIPVARPLALIVLSAISVSGHRPPASSRGAA